MTYCSIFPNVDKQFSCHYCVFKLAKEPKEIKSARLVMTAILVTFLILASAIITPSSSYLIGSANAQVDPNGDNDGDGLINSWETNGIPIPVLMVSSIFINYQVQILIIRTSM